MSVSPVLAKELAARREAFNARVAIVRAEARGFQTDAFSAFLSGPVDALVVAVHEASPDRTDDAVDALFDMALELVASGQAGPAARQDTVNRLWQEVAPGLAPLIAENPVESLGALSNAAVYISGRDDVRVLDWLFALAELAPEAGSIEALRALTALLTWRHGAAHMREAALRAADALPAKLACRAVGANDGDNWADIAAQFKSSIWWRPDEREPETPRKVGAFTGFGGRFATPPSIKASETGFWVKSGERYFELIVDAYGATFNPASAEAFEKAKPIIERDTPQLKNGTLLIGETRHRLPLPDTDLQLASNRSSAAVASPYSHAILIFPRHAS